MCSVLSQGKRHARSRLAAYEARDVPRAYIETIAVGDELPSMPLFLQPSWYIQVPLDSTYQTAHRGLPEYWRSVL